jgi:hypothetical protein
MPGFNLKHTAHQEHTTSSNPISSMHVEDAKLYMLSDLSECDHHKYCLDSLATVEDWLHHAEVTDSLESLHHHLKTHSFTNQFKIANVMGQIRNTCT